MDIKVFTDSMCSRFSDVLLATQGDDDLSISYHEGVFDAIGNEGRLYIKIFRDELQISYIVFKNKRVGTGTGIINECIRTGRELGLKKVLILGVMTEEMTLLCDKMKFSKLRENGFGHYDYILSI